MLGWQHVFEGSAYSALISSPHTHITEILVFPSPRFQANCSHLYRPPPMLWHDLRSRAHVSFGVHAWLCRRKPPFT
ncbi:hypothetical protein AB1N83_013891 [Pleurotus pulmonarius]